MFIVIAGLAAIRSLPIAQYPEIAPPVVTVTAVYPGASSEVIEQTVAAPLENAINGVERMIYMGSTSTSNGVVQIQVTFDIGTDADQAAQIVNNRVKQAETKLPQEVRRQGVTVEKGSSAFLQVLAFYSPDGSRSDLDTSNYVTLNVLDALKRVPGTTNVQIFGAKDYAMRVWLRPDRLAQLQPDDGRHHARDRRAERPVRGGQGGAVAHRWRAGHGLHDHDAGPADGAQAIRGDHRPGQPRRQRAAPEGRGPRRAGIEGLRLHRPHQRQGGHAGRHLPAARRECARAWGRKSSAPSRA